MQACSIATAVTAELLIQAPKLKAAGIKTGPGGLFGYLFIQITAILCLTISSSTSVMLQLISSPFSLPDALLAGHRE